VHFFGGGDFFKSDQVGMGCRQEMGVYFDDGWTQPAIQSDESLDFIDLPDSPPFIAQVSPERDEEVREESGSTRYGYGLAGDWSPRDTGIPLNNTGMQIQGRSSSQMRRRQIYEPLHNHYDSAQALLDAFSAMPEEIELTPECSRTPSTDPAQYLPASEQSWVGSIPRDRWAMAMSSDKGMPCISDFGRLSPVTCLHIYQTQPAGVAAPETRLSSIQLGTARAVMRSVTDEASSKLAHDLASKLAQRREWESKSLTDGQQRREDRSTDLNHSLKDNSDRQARTQTAFRANKSHRSASAAPTSTAVCSQDSNTLPESGVGDDAAVRRASSGKGAFPWTSQLQEVVHTKLEASGSPTRTGIKSANRHDSSDRIVENRQSDGVIVHVLEARMLGARRHGGLPDPCCWISLHHRNKISRNCDGVSGSCCGEVSAMDMKAQHTMRPHFKTPIIKHAQDPVWNSTTMLSVAYRSTSVLVEGIKHESASLESLDAHPINLFLTVLDGGESKMSFLGQASVQEILPGAVVDRWVTLQRRDGSTQMDSLGRVSSVRIKIEYTSTQPQTQLPSSHDCGNAAGGLAHHSCQQDFCQRASDRVHLSPYTLRASTQQHLALQRVQATARRMLANRAFRFTLLHSRVLRTDVEDDIARRKKMEVSSNCRPSRHSHTAEMIASSSDYNTDAALINCDKKTSSFKSQVRLADYEAPHGGQDTNRQSMMDYALRNRSILGQAEALLNLGLGLLDNDNHKEQADKYLYESWDLLESMNSDQLQNDRAHTLMQRLARCAVFKDRPDLTSRLAGLLRLPDACHIVYVFFLLVSLSL